MRIVPAVRVAAGLLLVAGVGTAAWLTVLRPAPPPSGSSGGLARLGGTAPPIFLPRLDGGTADLNAEHGNVVLLNFWATWCEPCRAEMPGLQQLADELRGQPFTLYSINLQEDPPAIEPFERQLSLHLPVLLDADGDVTRAYGVRALPATFVIDQQGVVRQQRLGPLVEGGPSTPWSRDWLAAQIHLLLAGG
jgi:thiol-disulfide isomerase/thioredoxin